MGEKTTEYAWAYELCRQGDVVCPADMLELLMSAPECPAFGPVHHFLVGAALLACASNAGYAGDLDAQLDELASRSACVPGGACARWGVCGAAASCGMALAIAQGNAPLKADGWSETQLMVADLLQKIAQAGAPALLQARCPHRRARGDAVVFPRPRGGAGAACGRARLRGIRGECCVHRRGLSVPRVISPAGARCVPPVLRARSGTRLRAATLGGGERREAMTEMGTLR